MFISRLNRRVLVKKRVKRRRLIRVSYSSTKSFETILTQKKGKIGWVTLNRPKQLNALNSAVMNDVLDAFEQFENDNDVHVIVITGNEKAFAAGADIKEMSGKSYVDVFKNNLFGRWDNISKIRKPIIAGVNGYALGGGCELAMMCDIIIAGDNAKFGQPEIKLGVIPGMGGTQRFTKALGKSRSMELVLTGDLLDVKEAAASGLVSRIVPSNQLNEELEKLANKIAEQSLPSVFLAKECINKAMDLGTTEGVYFERRMFMTCFATNDQKEGMNAFVEKRKPNFKNVYDLLCY